jgi:hypothetical protein
LIHFAPPLTSVRQHGAKLSGFFEARPMIFGESVIPFGNNEGQQRRDASQTS